MRLGYVIGLFAFLLACNEPPAARIEDTLAALNLHPTGVICTPPGYWRWCTLAFGDRSERWVCEGSGCRPCGFSGSCQ